MVNYPLFKDIKVESNFVVFSELKMCGFEITFENYFRCLKVCSKLRVVAFLNELITLQVFKYIVAYFWTRKMWVRVSAARQQLLLTTVQMNRAT